MADSQMEVDEPFEHLRALRTCATVQYYDDVWVMFICCARVRNIQVYYMIQQYV